MANYLSFVGLLLAILSVGQCQNPITSRILNGRPVDTIRRFPHHVTIVTENFERSSCSGSILSERWILTSLRCVGAGQRFRVDFQRQYENNLNGTFSVSLDTSNVWAYPTYYDDIALIKLPVILPLGGENEIRAIRLPIGNEELNGKLVVLPGFTKGENSLQYGMFKTVGNAICQSTYGDIYDVYWNLCTISYSSNDQVPCDENDGAGLVLGWPANPVIVGIFSTSNCSAGSAAVHVKLSEYLFWISDVTGIGNVPA